MLLQTKRLTIRPIEARDMEQMLSMLTDEAIRRTYMIPDFTSHEEAKRLAQRLIELSHQEERVVAGIARNGRLIGFINDVGIANGEIELGYVIDPAYQGRGYMTEALDAVVRELFARGYCCVTAGAFAENIASIRVMEKCGMRRSKKRETIEYRGKTHDCVYYAIEKARGNGGNTDDAR